MKKRRISFILPIMGGGGAQKVALHLLNNLDVDKYELYLILTNEGGDYLKYLSPKINVIELNKKRVRFAIFSLFKVLMKIKPDIVMIFSAEVATVVGLFLAPILRNIKFIVREINIQSVLTKSRVRHLLLKLSYENIYKIISQSRDMTVDLIFNTGIKKEKIIEINNPVDITYIETMLKKGENIELPYKSSDFNLLCVGRLAYQKGYDLIINIMTKLKDENIKLYILGEGPQRTDLEILIKEKELEDRVYLVGQVDNPYIYMKYADLFILSSRFEGFPNVLLEVGTCGVYSICNDSLGGINEIIQENINGNIVDFENKEKVAVLINKKLFEKHNAENTKNSVLSRYSLNIILEKYENFLDSL